jgi:hypothetical protein
MTRARLLASVANTIRTYRSDELDAPTPDHVDRWLNQFTPDNQLPFLREFDHVISQTFLTEDYITEFIERLIENANLTGGDHAAYWARTNFLSEQQNGQSQIEMLRIFDRLLRQKYNLRIVDCGDEDGDYIYLDDIVFTGGRISQDVTAWIRNAAPANCKLHIIVAARHTLGHHYIENAMHRVNQDTGKNIRISYWCTSYRLENRNYYRNSSQVLWPVAAPQNEVVQDYLREPNDYPFTPRTPGGALGLFSSEAGRQLLESEFLIAGATIRSRGQVAAVNRPLGHSFYGVGFGGLMVTYRNCPNNCPLAMWWGDPDGPGAMRWYLNTPLGQMFTKLILKYQYHRDNQ